jgi:phosphoglycerate dehydrogenase-like enzyme
MARIAALGFEMQVIGCEIREVCEPDLKKEFGFQAIVRDFVRAVREADFVSLHIPSTPENDGFINLETIAQMSSNAWLINTSRGSLVDESALYEALQSGRLAGAALDVFEKEPYQPASGLDLRTLPNVIMTPHISSSTVQASYRMARKSIHNIRLKEKGDFRSMDLLNPEVLSQ